MRGRPVHVGEPRLIRGSRFVSGAARQAVEERRHVAALNGGVGLVAESPVAVLEPGGHTALRQPHDVRIVIGRTLEDIGEGIGEPTGLARIGTARIIGVARLIHATRVVGLIRSFITDNHTCVGGAKGIGALRSHDNIVGSWR